MWRSVKRTTVPAVLLALLLAAGLPSAAAEALQLDQLTWTEARDALRAGSTTILIPIGGSEQNGPHMAIGKHNVRVARLSERIAAQLGHTLVAPVLAYVPESAGHMRFPGTIDVPPEAFTGIVAGAARSLRRHGFRDIVLLGDSGDYQPLLRQLADRLNREWAGGPTRVHYVAAYYEAASKDYPQLLREQGVPQAQVGIHAGLADTSLMLALDASLVREQRMSEASPQTGVSGDPSHASAALGQKGVALIIEKTVAAIRQSLAARR
jgi:creatinine amidohydrolase/Fe(II)-dependent formamide hydrolase-like protein